MRCPVCQQRNNTVAYTRLGKDGDDDFILRSRICSCGYRFRTYECYELANVEAAFELAEIRSTLDGLWVKVGVTSTTSQ